LRSNASSSKALMRTPGSSLVGGTARVKRRERTPLGCGRADARIWLVSTGAISDAGRETG
jgi:hypothetical protein